jgi:sugar O-acyltransferase (sialic acid O-acetyltransferase NeuD family)
MKSDLVIFGLTDVARLARFYFERDSDYRVKAFTVDREYLTEREFQGLPVVPFDEVTKAFPPASHKIFVAMGYNRINHARAEKYQAVKDLGYRCATYVSSKATCWTEEIGENCFILEDNTLQPFTKIGHNVTLWSGNHIGHDAVIGDHCFIASHVVISGHVVIEPYTFIGVNATLRNNIRIATENVIGAGALILADTEPKGVYIGTPAEKHRVSSDRLKRI